MLDFTRYQRQLLLPQMNEQKQKKLLNAKVLVVGVGGLGCPVLSTLTASGVGFLGMVDFDTVSLTNLHRQLLFDESDIGKRKTEVAKSKLTKLNSQISFTIYSESLTIDNIFEIVSGFDLVVDCTDNFPTRYLLNDVCFVLKKPVVYAAIYQNEGQLSVFNYFSEHTEATNLRDIFPNQPKQEDFPNCNEAGVMGVLTSVMGNFQANEVIKLLIGSEELFVDKLLLFNGLTYQTQTIKFKKNPLVNYPSSKSEIQAINYGNPCQIINSIQTKDELNEWIEGKNAQLIDVRNQNETPCIDEYSNMLQIPLVDFQSRIEEIETINKPIIFFCQTGVRSKKALDWTKDKFPNKILFHLPQGISLLLQ